jgi:hypothetical protein
LPVAAFLKPQPFCPAFQVFSVSAFAFVTRLLKSASCAALAELKTAGTFRSAHRRNFGFSVFSVSVFPFVALNSQPSTSFAFAASADFASLPANKSPDREFSRPRRTHDPAMGETISIGEMTELASERIFSVFGWERHPLTNQNCICVDNLITDDCIGIDKPTEQNKR